MFAVDLFSGCGGLSLGLRQAGFDVIGAVEIDSLAASTFKANHKKVMLWEKDIRDLSPSEMMRKLGLKRGELDLLAGCPPCQGFSSMRTLNGGRRIRDVRKNLVFEFLRFVRELMPKTIMMENVPGLAEDRRIRMVRDALEKLGYHCEYKVLDASNYGVPQRRRRMILLGGRNGAIPFAKPLKSKVTVRDVIGRLPRPGKSGDPAHDVPEVRSDHIRQLIRKIPRDGGSRSALGPSHQLECHKRAPGFNDVYGRMAWDKVAPTITCGFVAPSKGRFLHPRQNRCITLREAAILQSFPKSYFFSLERGKFPAATMIGNALPPKFIKRHATEIFRYLNATTKTARRVR